MTRGFSDLHESYRDMLDEGGIWPRGSLVKIVTAAILMLEICLMAHFCPFTVEAFCLVFLQFGIVFIALFLLSGIGFGVFLIYLHSREALEEARTAAGNAPPDAGELGTDIQQNMLERMSNEPTDGRDEREG